MSLDRHALLKGLAGGALFAPGVWPALSAAEKAAGPKRVVFFLQNHGFSPAHAAPVGVAVNERTLDKVEDQPLAGAELP